MKKQKAEPWFYVRESGLGWNPASWKGYAALVGYVVLLTVSSLAIFRSWSLFFGIVALLTIGLFLLASLTSTDNGI